MKTAIDNYSKITSDMISQFKIDRSKIEEQLDGWFDLTRSYMHLRTDDNKKKLMDKTMITKKSISDYIATIEKITSEAIPTLDFAAGDLGLKIDGIIDEQILLCISLRSNAKCYLSEIDNTLQNLGIEY